MCCAYNYPGNKDYSAVGKLTFGQVFFDKLKQESDKASPLPRLDIKSSWENQVLLY